MKILTWMRARPKALASAAAVVAGTVAVTTMAITYQGNPTTKVDLNDGGVWITKTSSVLVGHFNHESTLLDGGLRTTGENFDILQDKSNIVLVDRGSSTITAIDPARVSLGDNSRIPASAKVALGDKTAAILDQKSGKLWVVPVKGIAAFEIESAKPAADLGAEADVTVADDGTVFGLSSERGEVVTIPVDREGQQLEATTASLGDFDGSAPARITAVGRIPVVLDTASGTVTTPGGFRTTITDAADAVLQQASAAADAVAISTADALLSVPLDGSDPVVTEAGGSGTPAAPVSLRGCTYGAWAGSARFVRECPGAENDVAARISGAEGSASLTFRVNRDVIVLNDAVGGEAWLANESLQQVDNWNDITPPEGETENEEDSTQETVETTLPDRKAENTPPEAGDDSFGVRPGATTLLPVLDNDNDPDGDVLVGELIEQQPSIGVVQSIQNGGALQIAVDEKASGTASFTYEVNDGRGGKDTAVVTLSVHEHDVNAAPVAKRKTSLTVESGGTISYNILPDYIDPDGDDIYLQNVEPAPGDEVDFSTDGQITYKATASLQGRKDVQVTISDAEGEVYTGSISLDVRPQGSTKPKTNADHVVTRVGEQVTVAPLANDTSSGRERLRLGRVDEVSGATVLPDFTNNTFTFEADVPNTYYVQYLATAGPENGEGLVRVDVLDAAESDLPPVAVRDVALLPTGGDVLVGVLANDIDPSGGVLVIQSVSIEDRTGVSVSVLNHETLRITDQGALKDQVRISYTISNGTKSADGEVVVIPIPAPDRILQPVANPDVVYVRANDVVTIPVLDNDTHPSGDALHVAPALIEPFVDPADGEAFVSQDTVRFKAGSAAKTVYLTYEAVDSRQQKSAGYVTVQILPVDAETNAAPSPKDITARALSGTEIDIAIPLDGIDSDGDSVELLNISSSPQKGRINETGANYFTYEAFEGSAGVDTFTYLVRDHLGKESTATIRVGIAPPQDINQKPYAVKDAVVVRPGREIAVPVMANDSDPEGDKITLVSEKNDGLELPDIDGLSARVSGDRVLVEAPDHALETSLQYTIRDARGATASAVLQITVDEDVPLLAPVARDDRVRPEDLKDGGLTADIDILKNDEDPDGTTEGLKLDLGAGAKELEDGTVRVTVTDEMQLIRYTLTDRDGLEASAFIFVPATSGLRPTLKDGTKPVQVVSGETKSLPLSEYVTIAGGGTARITEHAKVSAVHANGADLVQDESTLVYTSAEGYFGQDAVTFEVTDGAGPDDPDGRKATLTIPIDVLPPENQPPSFTGAQMQVAPGEDATSLDLAALTEDPDPEDEGAHKYTYVSGAGDGIKAEVDGATLRVSASSDVAKGTVASLKLRVTDGTTEPVEGTVQVLVTASTRALPAANTDTVSEADQGKSITVPVLANDYNPFPDKPLKVLSAVTESGAGGATVKGDEVVVTPAANFVGTMIVRYRIQDATKDAEREANGQIVITVQGVPEAPGTPTITSVQDRTVVISYGAPSNNGAEITKYTVKAVKGGSYTKECKSTTCTLDGLTNNVEYAFQVTATNRVGEGKPSGTSEVARPDARPDTPLPPTLVFGDKSLSVSWKTPSTPGSPVESYTLEISPAPPSGITQKQVTGNSLVWEGLENGSNYQVRVQAHNKAPEPSAWSTWSAKEVPAGPPLKPAAPTTAEIQGVGDQAQMQVSWVPPGNNGDAIDALELQVWEGGSLVRTITPAADAKTQAVTVPTSETPYTYKIRAHNKAGWGGYSDASAPRRGVNRPSKPTGVSVTPTGADGQLRLAYTPGARNGASTSEIVYQYSLNGGGSWAGVPSNNVITGLSNGTDYNVTVRALATVSGTAYPGDSSDVARGNPYGPLRQPRVSATQNPKSVTMSWDAAPSANGRPISKVEINIDGGGFTSQPISGSITRGNAYSETHWIEVRVTDSVGQTITSPRTSQVSGPPPPPVAYITSDGNANGQDGCNDGTCAWYYVHMDNFAANTTYSVQCADYRPADGYWGSWGGPYSVTTDGNGHYQGRLGCYHGSRGYGTYQASAVINGKEYERRAWN